MNTATTLQPSTPSGIHRTWLAWACALLLAGATGAAQASVTLTPGSFAYNSAIGSVNGLGFGTSLNNWYSFGTPLTFQLGGTRHDNNAYEFLHAATTQDFQLESLIVRIGSGNDTASGWFNFYNDGVLVATGDAKAKKAPEYNEALSYALDIKAGTFSQALVLSSIGGYYDRVTIQYGKGKLPVNDVGISAFTFKAKDPGSKLGQLTVPSPIPEPSTYAMMLAGIGAIGFMTRRRRQSQD